MYQQWAGYTAIPVEFCTAMVQGDSKHSMEEPQEYVEQKKADTHTRTYTYTLNPFVWSAKSATPIYGYGLQRSEKQLSLVGIKTERKTQEKLWKPGYVLCKDDSFRWYLSVFALWKFTELYAWGLCTLCILCLNEMLILKSEGAHEKRKQPKCLSAGG